MIGSIILASWSVIVGLGFIFFAGFLCGSQEKWYWSVVFVFAGLVTLLSQVAKFLAFIEPLIK